MTRCRWRGEAFFWGFLILVCRWTQAGTGVAGGRKPRHFTRFLDFGFNLKFSADHRIQKFGKKKSTLKPNQIEGSAESESVDPIPFRLILVVPKWNGVHTLTFSRAFNLVWFDCIIFVEAFLKSLAGNRKFVIKILELHAFVYRCPQAFQINCSPAHRRKPTCKVLTSSSIRYGKSNEIFTRYYY